ncbi:hypothetical protein [Streptomyces sp. NPDC003023]|uniref:hypothetical protein n=1 Tax=Streptomyces sp. NPDC003023 TaxID=3364675 RepID=UPI0036869FB3
MAAPVLLGVGVLLRLPFPFFFPEQLAARVEHPGPIALSYGAFAAGPSCCGRRSPFWRRGSAVAVLERPFGAGSSP